MSVTLSLASLKVLAGVVGFGYSLFNSDITGDGKLTGKIQEAIFGETVGGIVADLLKDGTVASYDEFVKNLIQADKEHLNHDLQRAARKAQLLATFFACRACLSDIKTERSGFIASLKNKVWKDEDINWLTAVAKNIQDELKTLPEAFPVTEIKDEEIFSIFDRSLSANPEEQQKAFIKKTKDATLEEIRITPYSKILDTIEVSFSDSGFKLLTDKIENGWDEFEADGDFITTLNLYTPQTKQALLGNGKQYDWFSLVSGFFNEEYKTNERLKAALQRDALLNIRSMMIFSVEHLAQFGDSLPRLENTLTRVEHVVISTDNKLEVFIGYVTQLRTEDLAWKEKTDRKLDAMDKKLDVLVEGKREEPEQRFRFKLPSLNERVYGREAERDAVLSALKGETAESKAKRFALVVAPSAFGKTWLLIKALQEVFDEDAQVIKPDYENHVQGFVTVDCRTNTTFLDVFGEFKEQLGLSSQFDATIDEKQLEDWLKGNLFGEIGNRVWVLFDNFESWLDAKGEYKVSDRGIGVFLNALFTSNHNMRGLFLSQSDPERDVKVHLCKLDAVGETLREGLEHHAALDYLRTEGAKAGLDKADEALLTQFLEDISYIPQALSALVSYLESISDYTFDQFMDKSAGFWAEFDEDERDEDALARGIRRTKALIKRQIRAQSDDVKVLLMAIAFFDKAVAKEALELLFENKAKAANPISRLHSHNLANVNKGLRGTSYYDLHAYFREQSRIVLSHFENKSDEVLLSYAVSLGNHGLRASEKTYFQRAINFYECNEKIFCFLFEKLRIDDLANDLAKSYMHKGIALYSLGQLQLAIKEYDKAIKILEPLVKIKGRVEFSHNLASVYGNKGNALKNLGQLQLAIKEYDKDIEISEPLVNKQGKLEFSHDLAGTYMNKGNALKDSGHPQLAVNECNKAIEIYKLLVNVQGKTEFARDFAKTYMNKGIALSNLGSKLATNDFNSAIEIFESLVKEQGKVEFAGDLAMAYFNNGAAFLNILEQPQLAVNECSKAIAIFEPLVNLQGRLELRHYLAIAYINKGAALEHLEQLVLAIEEFNKAIKIYEPLVNDEGKIELNRYLAMAHLFKGNSFIKMPNLPDALDSYNQAVSLLEYCLINFGAYILPDLMKSFSGRIEVLFRLEEWQLATSDIIQVLQHSQVLADPQFPVHFKKLIGQAAGSSFSKLRKLSEDKREKVYKAAGEWGKEIRQTIDSLPSE